MGGLSKTMENENEMTDEDKDEVEYLAKHYL